MDARRYLSVAGEGGVVKQEVNTEEHHNGVVNAQEGPVNEGGPAQQRVLSDVSVRNTQITGNVTALRAESVATSRNT